MRSNDLALDEPSVHVVATIATALERLAIRVSRDLDVDAQEGVPPEDPYWASTIAEVAAYARECLAVLDDPTIVAALTTQADG